MLSFVAANVSRMIKKNTQMEKKQQEGVVEDDNPLPPEFEIINEDEVKKSGYVDIKELSTEDIKAMDGANKMPEDSAVTQRI